MVCCSTLATPGWNDALTNISKAKELGREQLDGIRTPCARMSLRLQAAFGLRREASIKIVPARADRGDTLVLKASWNKGGREIRIPIRTPAQWQLVDEAKVLANGRALGRYSIAAQNLAALPEAPGLALPRAVSDAPHVRHARFDGGREPFLYRAAARPHQREHAFPRVLEVDRRRR